MFEELGEYRCRLIVTNEYGCTDTVWDNVTIYEDFVVYVPNTFTPNGDQLNDVFAPVGVGISEEDFLFVIYDRWGNLIFESKKLSNGWDGRANGGSDLAQQDVYVWKLFTRDIKGDKHQYVGHVNLIR